MSRIIIAADIGTTNVKCVAADEGLNMLATASSEYETLNPGPSMFEHNPEDWYEHFKIAMRKALHTARAKASDVCRIAISAQAPTFLPVDASGKPLHNALIWMDRRSERQCDYMRELLGDERVYNITGNIIDPYFTLPKALWFRRERPQLYEKTKRFLQVNGYVIMRLTGETSIDESHATLTLGYDPRKGRWSEEILGALGVDSELFPKVYKAGDAVGEVTARASAETGVARGTPVLAGCPDAAAAMVEAGCSPNGASVEMTGTSSVLMVMTKEIRTSKKLVYMRAAHSGYNTLLGCMSTAGAALKWFRDTLYRETGDLPTAYQRMNEEIARDCPRPTKLLFLPYMAGERSPIWDTQAKGCIYGLTLGTTRAEIIRAIFEGCALALYDNYAAMEEAGCAIGALRSVGGASASEIWLRIKASVLDMPIQVPATNLGAPGGMTAIAAHSMGLSATVEEAAGSLLEIDRQIEPVREWTKIYRDKYELYKQLYANNRPLNARL